MRRPTSSWSSWAVGAGCTAWPLCPRLCCWRVGAMVAGARAASLTVGRLALGGWPPVEHGSLLRSTQCAQEPSILSTLHPVAPDLLALSHRPLPTDSSSTPVFPLPPGMAWLPESPRWLLLSGSGQDAAAAALRRSKGRVATSAAVQVGVSALGLSVSSPFFISCAHRQAMQCHAAAALAGMSAHQ